jgi:hypothetical protein
MNRIVVTKIKLNNTKYETVAVVTYKTINIFSLVISSLTFIINVLLVFKSPLEGPRYDWPNNL